MKSTNPRAAANHGVRLPNVRAVGIAAAVRALPGLVNPWSCKMCKGRPVCGHALDNVKR